MPKPIESYPKSWTYNPCGKELAKEYEHALQKGEGPSKELIERYGSLVGALQYPASYRPDVSFPVGVGGRCRTFPTAGMHTQMTRVLVYLARTHDLALHYVGDAEESRKLTGRGAATVTGPLAGQPPGTTLRSRAGRSLTDRIGSTALHCRPAKRS